LASSPGARDPPGAEVSESEGVPIRSVALHLLAAGLQGDEPRTVIEQILVAARRELEHSTWLERVAVCEMDPERARQVSAIMRDAGRRWPNARDVSEPQGADGAGDGTAAGMPSEAPRAVRGRKRKRKRRPHPGPDPDSGTPDSGI